MLSFGVVFSWPRSRCSSVQLRDLLPHCRHPFITSVKIALIDLLLSASSPSIFCLFLKDFHVWFFMYSRENRTVVPSGPESSCVVHVDFVISSHGPDDVIKLRKLYLPDIGLSACV